MRILALLGVPRERVIAISADAMPDDIAKGLAAGFDAYLIKPISLPEVIDHVKQALAGQLGPTAGAVKRA